MENQNRLTEGDWFITPDIPSFPSTHLVLTVKTPEIYIFNEALPGKRQHEWEIQWGDRYIDCSQDYNLNETAISKFTWGGKVSNTVISKFSDARHHGRLNRNYWKF